MRLKGQKSRKKSKNRVMIEQLEAKLAKMEIETLNFILPTEEISKVYKSALQHGVATAGVTISENRK